MSGRSHNQRTSASTSLICIAKSSQSISFFPILGAREHDEPCPPSSPFLQNAKRSITLKRLKKNKGNISSQKRKTRTHKVVCRVCAGGDAGVSCGEESLRFVVSATIIRWVSRASVKGGGGLCTQDRRWGDPQAITRRHSTSLRHSPHLIIAYLRNERGKH